jgi:glycine/D-amino acid oxidase-like deaminating enzyme
MSAGTAELVAAIARGDQSAIDPAPFAPGRFGL